MSASNAPDDGPLGPAPWRACADRVIDVPLRGQTVPYLWAIGDEPTPAPPFAIAQGETVLVRMRNQTLMRHPMHLHGHAIRLRPDEGGRAVWKDPATVNPGGVIEMQFAADNPGRWLFHCYHAYHQEAGMMRVVEYARR